MPAANNNYSGNYGGNRNGYYNNGNYNDDGRGGYRDRGDYGGNDGNGRNYNGRGGRRDNDDFRFEIVERYGVVATAPSGWSKELNRVSWNGKEPKFDLREWSQDHGRMRRGVTFTDEEALELKELLDIALSGRTAGARASSHSDSATGGDGCADASADHMEFDPSPLVDYADGSHDSATAGGSESEESGAA